MRFGLDLPDPGVPSAMLFAPAPGARPPASSILRDVSGLASSLGGASVESEQGSVRSGVSARLHKPGRKANSARSARGGGGTSGPYLDVMSVQAHLPLDARDVAGLSIDYLSDPHKMFVVHQADKERREAAGAFLGSKPFAPPLNMPNLDHTGVRTPFTYHGPNFLRPDGSVSTELAANIQAAYGRLPRVPVLDHHDMAHRDYNKQVDRHAVCGPPGSSNSPGRGLLDGGGSAFAAAASQEIGPQVGLQASAFESSSSAATALGSTAGSTTVSRGVRIVEPESGGLHKASLLAASGRRSLEPSPRRGPADQAAGQAASAFQAPGGLAPADLDEASALALLDRDLELLAAGTATRGEPPPNDKTRRRCGKASGKKFGKRGDKGKRLGAPPERLKKPFSHETMLKCLLDVEFGSTDAKRMNAPGPAGHNWDMSQYHDAVRAKKLGDLT